MGRDHPGVLEIVGKRSWGAPDLSSRGVVCVCATCSVGPDVQTQHPTDGLRLLEPRAGSGGVVQRLQAGIHWD